MAETAEIDPTLPHYEVRVFLADRDKPLDKACDHVVARLLGLPEGPAYSSDLNVIVRALNDAGLWWHLSHLQAQVTPNRPVKGMEGLLSNGAAYDREGRPISYTTHFASDNPAMALCEAWIKAAYDLPAAFYVRASAKEEAHKKVPSSSKAMGAYYAARERLRQAAIRRYAAEHGEV